MCTMYAGWCGKTGERDIVWGGFNGTVIKGISTVFSVVTMSTRDELEDTNH